MDGWVGGCEQRFQLSNEQSGHVPSPKLGSPLFFWTENTNSLSEASDKCEDFFLRGALFSSLDVFFYLAPPTDNMLTLTPAWSLVVSGTLRR